MRSSLSPGSRAGTLSSAALTIVVVMSSGRKSTSDPLNARPIGERAVATMTASGMTAPRRSGSVQDTFRAVEVYDSVVELIGNTPLVRLRSVAAGIDATVLAKVEYLNPGGSVKDRIATRMIEAAEESGELKPGGTIVEPTSGNTGVGLAMVAQARGYRCVFVCPDKVSEDKRNVLKAYGAEVVVCPTAVAPEHPDSYYNVSDRLSKEPGAWKPDQYS